MTGKYASSKNAFHLAITRVLAACAATVLCAAAHAQGQTVPLDKPLTLVAHTAAGSATDLAVRELGKALQPVIKRPVLVVNRPGGSGAVQMTSLRDGPADGYTLGLNTSSHLTVFHTAAKGKLKRDDFVWLAGLQTDPFVLYVRDDSPIKSLKDLVALAKQKEKAGQKLNVAGALPQGSAHNIAFNIFAREAGFDFNWVAFSGNGEIAPAVLGGHVDVGQTNPGPLLPLAQSGRVRVLAVMNAERIASYPDVPTYAEAGFPVDTTWAQVRGIFGNRDIPKAMQDKLTQAILLAAQSDGWKAYMERSSLLPLNQDQQAYTELLAKQEDIGVKWMREIGLIKE